MTAIYLAIGIIARYRLMRKAKAYEANHPEQFTEADEPSNPAQL